jgi:hypothetical protein
MLAPAYHGIPDAVVNQCTLISAKLVGRCLVLFWRQLSPVGEEPVGLGHCRCRATAACLSDQYWVAGYVIKQGCGSRSVKLAAGVQVCVWVCAVCQAHGTA